MQLSKTNLRDTINFLINFEKDIKDLYEKGRIKSPIHLSGNNEKQLIKIFRKINKNDWVFSTWRNHYHALLKGLKTNDVKNQILKGKSMNINDLSKKFFTSSIVGGIIPIALGTALAIKIKKKKNKVWVFIGDMTYETGGFYDARDGSYTDASGARFEESDFERSGLHATEQVGAHSNDSDEKSDAFEIFNGQKLPVVAPSERKSTDLVGLSTREARRAQKERQRGESAIAASRRTITQASESERQSKQRTLGDELKEFNLPQDLLKQFADQGALDKPIGGGGEEVTDFTDIAHMGKRLLSRKDKKVDAHEEKSTNAGDATQQPVAAESAQTVLQTPPPPLQPELQTLGQYFEPPPQSANGQTVSNNARKTALLDLARASAAQMEATAAQWRAMATLFESAE